jgi:hypothetical protein
MWILMAVAAAIMRDWPVKVIAFVALFAWYLRVLSDQRELCHVMIEHSHGAGLFPAIGVVAPLTLAIHLHRLEGIVMRILVATLAAIERQAFEQAHFYVSPVRCATAGGLFGDRLRRRGSVVALFAGNLPVQAGEWKWSS